MSVSLLSYKFKITTREQQQERLNELANARYVPPIPISYFFGESTLCDQAEAGAYGPVPSDPTNKFRITSVFECSGSKKIYAPFPARIFIQPSLESTGKVNVLLKPLTAMPGIKIKYFIFRGLKKSDFLASETRVKKLADATGPSDFLTRIWSVYDYWNPGAPDDFDAKFIGYDPGNQSVSDLIDRQFFQSSDNVTLREFEYFTVLAGEWIGSFAGKLGIDIVMDYGDFVDNSAEFRFDLGYLRKEEIVINMGDYTENYQKKRARENIFNFIDPAAFYGFHVANGSVKMTNNTAYKGNDIYTYIVSKFFNRNKVFLYIRSNAARSYNYYKNYTTNAAEEIQIGADETSLTTTSYATSSWPVIIYHTPQTNDENYNKLFFKLVCKDDGKNEDKCFYNIIGDLQGIKDGNWAYSNGPDDIETDINETICKEGESFTSPIQYHFRNVLISGQRYFVANLVFAFYIGKDLPVLNEPGGTDNIKKPFLLVNADPLFSEARPIIEEQVSEKPGFIADTFYAQITGNKYIIDKISGDFKFGIEILTRDYDYPNTSGQSPEELSTNRSVEKGLVNSFFTIKTDSNQYYNLHLPYFFDRKNITVGDNPMMCLSAITLDDPLASKYFIGFTKELKDELYAYIDANHIVNVSIYLKYVDAIGYNPSNAEEKCYKYKLDIIAENAANEYTYIEFSPANSDNNIIYSLDKQVFFSKKYTQNIPESEIDSIINFQSYKETDSYSFTKLEKRLKHTNVNPVFCLLYDLKGNKVSYADGEKNALGETKSGDVHVPVGTKVVHIGDSKNNIQGLPMAYICFYHCGKFREGFIDHDSLDSPEIRLNTSDVIANSDLHVDAFIDDAELVLRYNEYLYNKPYTKVISPAFVEMVGETMNLYRQLITTNNRQQLKTKLVTLFNRLNDVNSPISLLPLANNLAETVKRYMDFEPLKKIADENIQKAKSNRYPKRHLLSPLTNKWIDDRNISGSPFADFLNTSIVINSGTGAISYKYENLVGDSYYGGNGEVTRFDMGLKYDKLLNFYIKMRLFLLSRPDTDAVKQTPEAQWLINLSEEELKNFIVIVVVDEKDGDNANPPWNIWRNQQLKNVGDIATNDAIGFINPATCLMVYTHETNTQSFGKNFLIFDTHSFNFRIVDPEYKKIVALLRNNRSCIEYFDYFYIDKNDGNWQVYLTSFHKTILYLNYFLKKL